MQVSVTVIQEIQLIQEWQSPLVELLKELLETTIGDDNKYTSMSMNRSTSHCNDQL